MCLCFITACLGLLPVVPIPAPVPILPPTTTTTTTTTTTPPPPPPPPPTAPPVVPAACCGAIIPLVICANPEVVCVFNPNDLSGKMGPYATRLGTNLASPAAVNSPPITGYSAQVPSFDTSVKFPRFRRSTSQKHNKKGKKSADCFKSKERKHRIKKRQFCGCVPIGTCISNDDTVIIGAPEVQCLAGQDYCCGGTVDIAAKISCGVTQTIRSSGRTTRSALAGFGENPWQGALLSQTKYVSGTVLINELNVLTVSHKVLPYVSSGKAVDLKVRMGEWNSTHLNPSFYQEYSVSKVFSHPNFRSDTLQNDIALLRLSSAVPFTPSAGALATINRACLPPTEATVYTGQRCVVAGWGHQVFGTKGSIQSEIKSVDVPIVDPAKCQTLLRATRLGPSFTLDNKLFICAGGETDKDACTGDGGSGLLCEVEGKWILVGLVSWGIGCGSPNVPGVYTNVASFLPWIKQQIAAA